MTKLRNVRRRQIRRYVDRFFKHPSASVCPSPACYPRLGTRTMLAAIAGDLLH